MTAYLVILVIILFGVAVWQINKVFKLLQPAKSEDSEVATDKDNETQGYMMLAFVFFIYWILAYCFWKWGNVLLPVAASEHGLEIDQLMLITMVVIFAVGIVTQWLLHYFAFVYRGSKDKKALFYAENHRLEFIWTIIPVIVLAVLIIYGLFTWTDIMSFDEDDDPREIRSKKRAFKEELFNAKKFLEGNKEKYYADLKLNKQQDIPQEYQEAFTYYNEYKQSAESNEQLKQSFLQKTDNVFNDKYIEDYVTDPFMQLIESERLKNIIRDFEQDLWSN